MNKYLLLAIKLVLALVTFFFFALGPVGWVLCLIPIGIWIAIEHFTTKKPE
jgi:uncharacterized protein YaaW (UPF0174 family)